MADGDLLFTTDVCNTKVEALEDDASLNAEIAFVHLLLTDADTAPEVTYRVPFEDVAHLFQPRPSALDLPAWEDFDTGDGDVPPGYLPAEMASLILQQERRDQSYAQHTRSCRGYAGGCPICGRLSTGRTPAHE